MKHIFVVNPKAGGRDNSKDIETQLQGIEADTEIYVTRGPRDATAYVADRCRIGEGPLRFYACGGDGTMNEVVSGLLAAGRTNAAAGIYPCGSGNDYIKCWPETDFHNLGALVAAPTQAVDALRLDSPEGTRYCLNVMNFGFEAEVCRTMNAVRRWPLLGGRMAYVTGIFHCLLHAMHNPCHIAVDGEDWRGGDLLLASAANGRYVGGGYKCAPRAVVDDGLMEVLCVDSLNLLQFAKIIGFYKKGEHLDHPELEHLIHYRRGRRAVFHSDREFSIVVDGELIRGRHFDVSCLPQAVNFIVPQKSATPNT